MLRIKVGTSAILWAASFSALVVVLATSAKLPAEETDSVYGEPLTNAPDPVQAWEFPWGTWLVNATTMERSVEVPGHAGLKRMLGGEAARFAPLAERPLTGTWSPDDPSPARP